MKIDLVLTILQVAVFVVALFVLIWCAFDMCQMRCERKKLVQQCEDTRINHLQQEIGGIAKVINSMLKADELLAEKLEELKHEVEAQDKDICSLQEAYNQLWEWQLKHEVAAETKE